MAESDRRRVPVLPRSAPIGASTLPVKRGGGDGRRAGRLQRHHVPRRRHPEDHRQDRLQPVGRLQHAEERDRQADDRAGELRWWRLPTTSPSPRPSRPSASLACGRADLPYPGTSAINWFAPNQTVANGGTVSVGNSLNSGQSLGARYLPRHPGRQDAFRHRRHRVLHADRVTGTGPLAGDRPTVVACRCSNRCHRNQLVSRGRRRSGPRGPRRRLPSWPPSTGCSRNHLSSVSRSRSSSSSVVASWPRATGRTPTRPRR